MTRLSLGVQSMVPHVLALLGRTHDPANVRRAVELARAAGFETFNLDLIYGSVGESLDDWRATVERGARPRSAARLRLRADRRGRHAAGRSTRPATPTTTTRPTSTRPPTPCSPPRGLACYEISNWARPGHECRHNLLYWSQGDYRGFGCAAHSHRAGRRWWNVRTPERYVALIDAGEPAEGAGEDLDGPARRIEGLQLQLRTRAGVPADALDADELPGLVEAQGDRLVLTRAGRLLANEVALRLR